MEYNEIHICEVLLGLLTAPEKRHRMPLNGNRHIDLFHA